ncbi:DISEASE RESISTANCE PROTEIN RP [Salix viminalis]|uniref:DISEASE RESISTANCE PROTEIN RP n=1 Tax=Salix viminalis TaxID=40686 RepID=A0A9Q0UVF9_SALVM|nr:DISEASE RESISTANCE PROTEIN RP [Salix viminalis]
MLVTVAHLNTYLEGLGRLSNLEVLLGFRPARASHHGSDLVDKLDKLYPPPGLLELCLQFYPGKLSPAWLNPISLHMLRYLWISSGNLAVMHESFFGENNSAWNIEGLMFESLSDLEMEWQTVQQVMPSLKTVNASWCPNLESFPIEDVGFRGGVWKKGERGR